MAATLDDFMRALSTDNFLGDTDYAEGACTWSDTCAESFGASAGGLVSAAVRAGYVESNGEYLTLTRAGAERIAEIRAERCTLCGEADRSKGAHGINRCVAL